MRTAYEEASEEEESAIPSFVMERRVLLPPLLPLLSSGMSTPMAMVPLIVGMAGCIRDGCGGLVDQVEVVVVRGMVNPLEHVAFDKSSSDAINVLAIVATIVTLFLFL